MIDLVTSLATVPAIVALVNLLKGVGLTGRWSALVAVALGIGLSVATWAWADYAWWTAASSGMLLGLGAAGLYDLAPQSDARRAVED